MFKTYSSECNKVKVHTCTRKFDNSSLGILVVTGAWSSDVKVPGLESCHRTGLITHRENLG